MVNRLLRTAVLLTCFTAGFGALGEETPPAGERAAPGEGPPAVEAVYKRREVGFTYRSDIAVYDCGALKTRVASILRAMGARDDVQVRVDDCFTSTVPSMPPGSMSPGSMSRESMSRPYPPDPTDPWRNTRTSRLSSQFDVRDGQLVHVRINVMWPTEVTPQILTEIKKDASRRDLISRVTGDPAARLNDPIVFPAARQQVTLSRKTIGLAPIECELLDQMSTGVFRKLDVRVVNRSVLCNRDGSSRIPPQMTVESLAPLPIGAVQLPSMEGEEEATEDEDSAATEAPSPP